jgi:ResB-like family
MPLNRLIKFFASLRLTVVCLAFGIALVFFGTLAQVDEGLYAAQNRWFRSFFIINAHIGRWPVPLFPGGYLIGITLLINLITAHITRFKLTWRKSGIFLVHAGLVLLLLGQLFTDMFATEGALRLSVGETRNFSEDFHANELVVIDTSDPTADQVVAIPESIVAKQGEINHASLPVTLHVKGFWPNCELLDRPPAGAKAVGATHGTFAHHLVLPLAETDVTEQARAAVLIEMIDDHGTLGTWLVPTLASRMEEPERFRVAGRHWNMTLVYAPAMGGNFLMITDPGSSQEEQPDPISERDLKAGRELTAERLPFKIRVREFWPRCRLYRQPSAKAVAPEITRGPFSGMIVEPLAEVKTQDERNLPAALVEVVSPQGSLGTWLLPSAYDANQGFTLDGKKFQMAMRFARHYKPFSVTLLEASHKKYRGTEIARDYRSRVRVQRENGEALESEVYMNAPLRFGGYTFFQYQMAADESVMRPGERPTSTFQVVKNPSWLAPYISCIVVGFGLVVQFMIHLVGFIIKRVA